MIRGALWMATLVVVAGCATTPQSTTSTTAVYTHAAVAADHPLASEAGVEILRQGGNAVDAAVATSFALSVVRPYSCGLGGGGFMVIAWPPQDGGDVVALDYRETAPAAAGPTSYVDLDDKTASRFGVHAAGVPGTVAGLLTALDTYGTLGRATVLAPAIRLAETGFPADVNFVSASDAAASRLAEHPHLADTARWLDELIDGGTLAVGDWIVNPEQADALRLIAADGADAFYRGPIGAAIVDVMQRHGGWIDADDLASYTPRTRTPLTGRFGDLEIVTMPPPSSGGLALVQILGLLERHGIGPGHPPADAAAGRQILVESMKHAFADRARWLADPDFVDLPIAQLMAPSYLDDRAASIDLARTKPPETYGRRSLGVEDSGTSHLSVIDEHGLAVACTETINLKFGSLVDVPGFGFVLNNEMDDFTTIPGAANAFGLRQSDDNLPAAGKRPLSSMSPTIVRERDGRVVAVAGASGGPRIITGTLQALLNSLVWDMPAQVAVDAARLHHQWQPDRLDFEEGWTDERARQDLVGRGHATGARETVGKVQLLRVRDGVIEAASDPRKGGRPAGY